MEITKAICIKTYVQQDDDDNIQRFIKGRIYTVVVKYYDKRYFKIIKDEKTS
jgi:hypothetical protein